MIGQSDVKSRLKVDVAVSPLMADALSVWSALYANQAGWLVDSTIHSLNLPAGIASEIARAVTIEMQVDISGSARADYLAAQFARVMPKLRIQVEYGVAKGGLMLKPYVDDGRIMVDFVQADMFYPVAFDSDGDITACVFADQRQVGEWWYTRLEYHSMTPTGCEIINMAFRSSTKDTLGSEVPLSTIDEWADILPQATIEGIDRPLFAYFKFPMANQVDTTSPLGVSCYSLAVDQIEDADRQWSRLMWEFESGERALYVDLLALTEDEAGNKVLPNKRLYKTLNMGGAEDALFQEWSPDLRQEDLLSGLDAILKRIEFMCGLAYGTLSDPNIETKTATEIKSSKQRSYVTITDTQKALQAALEQLIWAMDTWATLDRLAPRGAYATVFTFDDSVVVDTDLQFQQDLRLVNQRIMSKVEFRTRNFRESEEVARAKIAEVEAENPVDESGFFGAGA